MHPQLWIIPGTHIGVPAYGFLMLVGFVLAVWLSVVRAKRVGADASVVTSMAAIGGLTGYLGSRGMHLVHYYWARLVAGQMDAAEVMATLASGGEVLGGVVAATVCVIAYLAVTRRPIGRYLDIMFPPMILAMGIGRVGCLLYGCCWGQVCQTEAGGPGVPWAVHFPYGAPAHFAHCDQERLTIPDDLIFRVPGSDVWAPLPRHLLHDSARTLDQDLARCVEHLEAVAELRRIDPNHPDVASHQQALRVLQPRLPGGSKLQQAEYLAAAVHLRKLAARDGQTPEAAFGRLRELAASQHSLWVHPTQVYDAAGLGILFVLLSAIFYRKRRDGVVVGWTMVLYSAGRFTLELLRDDNPHDVFGLTVSQFISLSVLAIGLIYLVLLTRFAAEQPAQRAPHPA